jgi:hypothetical protein
MVNDDQLRERIGRLDPIARADLGDASIEPVTSPRARSLLEDIMNTPAPIGSAETPRRRTRPTWFAAGAAASIVAVAVVGVALLTGGDDEPTVAIPVTTQSVDPGPSQPGKLTVIDLQAGTEDLMASCAVLDPTILAMSPIAFRGTVTMADNGVVQLMVDRAYAGIDAQVVTLSAPEGMEALIGGISWEVGAEYLVSAYDGVVSYCGQTGRATPELQAIYDAAFPS